MSYTWVHIHLRHPAADISRSWAHISLGRAHKSGRAAHISLIWDHISEVRAHIT